MSIADLTDRDAVHQHVCSLRGQRGELDYDQGRWLLAAYRLGLHDALGLGSFAEYAERYGGVDGRQARERVRVAEALESLPLLADALRTGVLGWSAVRELTRVAVESTDARWLEAARGRTVREVERMVARHRKGDDPFDQPQPEEKRRVSFELAAPTWALVKEAREAMTAAAGGSVDDDAFLAELVRAYLAGAGKNDEGRAPYSIAITVCDECRTAKQRAGGDDVVIDAATLEQACCDAQLLGRVDVANPPKATQTIPPRIRRAVLRRHGGRCAVPGCCGSAFKELHHSERRADGGDHDPDKLIPLCTRHHAAAHRGTLVIRGTYSSGFVFEHADGRPYGAPDAEPSRSSTLATVLELLVAMGFKQREAQAMVDRAKPHVGTDADVNAALKVALRQAPMRTASVAREGAAPYVRLAA